MTTSTCPWASYPSDRVEVDFNTVGRCSGQRVWQRVFELDSHLVESSHDRYARGRCPPSI
ncbi:conserved hypothetical protein [Histoplasma capsulatum var. duboisii H88]|uniref:Uncharacterized protein n=1 Tax=Ajellomyces capsulatus (strain H88) TaxID=544711 RepID=F0UM52_AJEC8|nr:conserved hypothetical protein [Histoplasma capsulatum var. duboisii H88]